MDYLKRIIRNANQNIKREMERKELYDYLSDLDNEELKRIFYISSLILKERKHMARIYAEFKNYKGE